MPDQHPAGPRRAAFVSAGVLLLALAVAAYLRFAQIGLKPLHHDEGVNAHFLLELWRNGTYAYRPENYHGPTLYYFALAALAALGETDLALRFWPAAFGLLMVGLLWWLRRELGDVGAPVAAWLVALSPGLVYFSRDFIHEMSFVCFTLGVVVGAWRYAATRRFAPLALLAASAGLLFATKETALMTVVILALAVACAAVWDVGRRLARARNLRPAAVVRELRREARGLRPTKDHLLSAAAIFIFINVIFYSSIFTHWRGIIDAVRAVFMWTERGVIGHEHDKAFHYYLGILVKLELPLLAAALPGAALALWRGSRFALFLTAWATGMTLAYSLIPYKTPWLALSMLLPLALLGGSAAQQVWDLLRPWPLRLAWGAALAAALGVSGWMAYRVNFEAYADNRNRLGYLRGWGERLGLPAYRDEVSGYVYAQTDPDLLNLVQAIEDAAAQLPQREHTGIHVATPDYWPLPWYLRHYDGVAYAGSLPAKLTAPVVIAAPGQEADVERLLGAGRRRTLSYTLRPGVPLVLHVRGQG